VARKWTTVSKDAQSVGRTTLSVVSWKTGKDCGEPQFGAAEGDTLLNPTVLVDVLSPATADYDRGSKCTHYRRL
jgi:hypothetical protein